MEWEHHREIQEDSVQEKTRRVELQMNLVRMVTNQGSSHLISSTFSLKENSKLCAET